MDSRTRWSCRSADALLSAAMYWWISPACDSASGVQSISAGSCKRLSGSFFQFSRCCGLRKGRETLTHLFVRRELAGVCLSDAFLNERDVVLVQREILIDGFVQNEAAVALLESSERIESFDLVSRGAECDCLLLHALRIRCVTAEYQSP